MREVEVAGIRTAMLPPLDGEKDDAQLYYLINLAELTWETLLWRQKTPLKASAEEARRVRQANEQTWESLAWQLLAGWFYMRPMSERTPTNIRFDNGARRLKQYLADEPYNAWCVDALALDKDETPTHLPEGHEYGAGGPVILTIKVNHPVVYKAFRAWYDKELRSVKGRAVDQQLRWVTDTLGVKIERMRAKVSARERSIVAPLREGLTRLRIGEAVFQAEFDFAAPAQVREKKWAGSGAAWSTNYIYPTPPGPQQKRLRDRWDRWKALTTFCQDTMTQAISPEALDPLAHDILAELRKPDAPIYQVFDRWDDLIPEARASLLQMLTDAVQFALRGKSSKEALLRGELAAIAHMASDEGAGPGPTGIDDFSLRMRAAHDALVLTDELPLDAGTHDRPLVVLVAKGLKDLKRNADRGIVALDLLSLATPHVFARMWSSDNTNIRRMGWLWRVLVGSTERTDVEMNELSAAATEIGHFVRTGTPSSAGFFEQNKGALSRAHKRGSHYFKLVAVVTDLILLDEAIRSNSGGDDPAEMAKNIAEVCKYGRIFGGYFMSLAKTTQTSKILAADELASAGSKLATGSKVVPVLNVIAATAIFYASVESARTERWKRTSAEQQKLDDAVYFDYLNFMMAMLTLTVGMEFALLGLVVFAVRTLVLDPDSWLPALLPGLEFAKRPQKYLAEVLEAMAKDGKFNKAVDAAEEEGLSRASDLRVALKDVRSQLQGGVDASAPAFWELWSADGPFGVNHSRETVDALERVYGVPERVAKELAGR